jgi:hypothetical protein
MTEISPPLCIKGHAEWEQLAMQACVDAVHSKAAGKELLSLAQGACRNEVNFLTESAYAWFAVCELPLCILHSYMNRSNHSNQPD